MTAMDGPAGLIAALAEAPVLCVGDVMLDHYQYGTVDRVSPEAPVPVLRLAREDTMLGGAGNVVRNLVALGAPVYFVSVVGDDTAGRTVRGLVDDQAGCQSVMVVDDSRSTTTKTRYLAGAQQLLRADRETAGPLRPMVRDEVVDGVGALLPQCAAVALSDYGKGVLGADTTADLITAARAAGKPVIVDPKGTDYGRYRGADVITPNRRELAEATRMPTGTDDEITAAARRIIDDCGVAAVLVTRSHEGMTLVMADGTVTHLAAEAREVFDVSGAGDTVVATVAAALGAGASLAEAAALANLAAGIVVGKVGTAVAYAAEVVAAIHHHDIATAEGKIATLEEARDQVERWRRRGLRIGFTNGCFDLLHPGHVSLFRQARDACDRLVVGLNSDASVTRLKGPDRPIQNEAARATVLASLATVDTVVIFSEDTPLTVIESLRPDVLVKGADYRIDTVVGADLVQGYGGRVLLAELEPGHSTSATISRIAEEPA